MAHEDRKSLFGVFGNQNYRFRGSPVPVPDTRRFVDYAQERKGKPLPSPNIFKDTGYRNIEPTVIPLDLSVARVDLQLVVSGTLVWYMKSTNLSDLITIKYNQSGAVGLPFQPGNKLGGVPYSNLFISNAAIAGATGFLILLQDSPENPITVL